MKAYCHLSIVPVRKSTSDASEMVNQLLYGEKIKILKQSGNWCFIQSELDDYQGWVDKKQIEINDKFESTSLITQPLVSFSSDSQSKRLFLAGSYLSKIDESNITNSNLHPLGIEKLGSKKPIKDVVDCAKKFLNAPYLWGGRSVFGIDCSGLTQIAFRLIGINIKRDASEQAEMGKPIDHFIELENGDLAFFNKGKSDRITHVGIVIKEQNNTMIIHASGQVKIDKLTKFGIIDRNEQLTHHTLFYKRISS